MKTATTTCDCKSCESGRQAEALFYRSPCHAHVDHNEGKRLFRTPDRHLVAATFSLGHRPVVAAQDLDAWRADLRTLVYFGTVPLLPAETRSGFRYRHIEKNRVDFEGVIESVTATGMVRFAGGREEHIDGLRAQLGEAHTDEKRGKRWNIRRGDDDNRPPVTGWLLVEDLAATPAAGAGAAAPGPQAAAPSVAAKVVEYGPKIAAGVAVAAGVVAAARLAWEQPEVKLAAHLVRSKLGDVLGDLRREVARRAAGPEGGGNKSNKETGR